ncbi:MAG TPA: TIGR01777 family oxidoreductase [Thermoanaerobaculia bacterium]|nr:TIGR01777 family oxidoreductase [Thermoanaerobaculia bacterium]
MNERILITGGSGLIGRALTADLAAAGYEVVVLSRSPEKVTGLPENARAAGWDGDTADGWGPLADGALGIVHLAGESIAEGRWTDEKKRRIRASRVDSSHAVLAAIERAAEKPRFLLQGSAVGYYGDRGSETLDEESSPGEGFLPEVCVEWEAATEPAEEMGVRRALLRTGLVLAADGGALAKMVPPYKLGLGGPLGSGEQYMPWIHLDDEVGALRFLVEHADASGPFNLTAPNPVTNATFSAALARTLGRPNLLRAPKFALRLAFGEMADALLQGQRALPAALERIGYRFRFPEIGPALADLLGGGEGEDR